MSERVEYYGPPLVIVQKVSETHPEVIDVLSRVAADMVRKPKREIAEYQAAALYALARKYDRPDAKFLEIGTALGYSARVLAEAAPQAFITTLNPRADEIAVARKNLARYPNVDIVQATSVDYLASMIRADPWHRYDLVFVDGDHARVVADLPYWNFVAEGGLFVFHDFSPAGTYRECLPVFEAVSMFASWLGRWPDAVVIDDRSVGMAGFVRRADDPAWR